MKPQLFFLLLSLLINPLDGAVSTISAFSIDGNGTVSYSQWLASSFVAEFDAESKTINNLTLKFQVKIPNQHLFVGVTGSAAGKPDLTNILVEMETSPVMAQPLNATVTLTLEPTEASKRTILPPDGAYWVVFGVQALDHDQTAAGGLFEWSYTTELGPYESEEGWAVGTHNAYGNTEGQNWSQVVETPYSFGVSLESVPVPIPEPTTITLLLAFLSQSLVRRHRESFLP